MCTLPGVLDNWHEYKFWRKYRLSVCQPTYLSLLGFVNVQKYGIPLDEFGVKSSMVVIWDITNGSMKVDMHAFGNESNYCVDGEVVRFLDYGSVRMYPVLLEYGDKILAEFKPHK